MHFWRYYENIPNETNWLKPKILPIYAPDVKKKSKKGIHFPSFIETSNQTYKSTYSSNAMEEKNTHVGKDSEVDTKLLVRNMHILKKRVK